MLILRTLAAGPSHGQGIARLIQLQSEDTFLVDHGSLYLALQRLEEKDLVSAEWGISANNRKRPLLRPHPRRPPGTRHPHLPVAQTRPRHRPHP